MIVTQKELDNLVRYHRDDDSFSRVRFPLQALPGEMFRSLQIEYHSPTGTLQFTETANGAMTREAILPIEDIFTILPLLRKVLEDKNK